MGLRGRLGKLIGLGLLAWYSVIGWPDTGWPVEGLYRADSPTLRRQVLYDDDEIQAEAERILEEERAAGRSGMGGLVEMLPLFCQPDRLISTEARRMAEDWNLCRTLNVPLAASLDEVPARMADAAQTIERETVAAQRWLERQKRKD